MNLSAPPSSFKQQAVAADASLRTFIVAFQFEAWEQLDLSTRLLAPHGLLCIPYAEWRFEGEDIAALFRLATLDGARSGWAVPLGRPVKPETECLKYPLDANAAHWLAHELLPFEPMLLIDDQFRFALLTWHSDEAFLCLKPHLFATYLAEAPVDFGLDGGRPIVDNFDDALREAFGRLDAWRAMQDSWSAKRGGKLLPPLPGAYDGLRRQQLGVPE